MKKFRRKKSNLKLIIFLIVLLCTSLGYAIYSQELVINGNISGSADFRVYFAEAWIKHSNVEEDHTDTPNGEGEASISSGTVEINTSAGADTVTFDVTLNYPGDKVLIGTRIKNESSMRVKLNDFLVTKSVDIPDITMNYLPINTTTEKLDPNGECIYEFVVEWTSGSSDANPGPVRFDIELDYEQDQENQVVEILHTHDNVSNLKINYIDENGNRLAKSFNSFKLNGSRYSVQSPKVNGYIPNNDIIEGEINGDTEINVIYYKLSGNLSYTNVDSSTCMVSGIGNCTDVNIVIPETFEGKTVVGIREGAFRNNRKIQSVVIPNTVQTIQKYSFSGCTTLKTITILSENLQNIEDENFIGCSAFERYIVNSENSSYKAIDGILFSKDETKIIRYPQGKKDTEYTIPSTVTEVVTRALDQNQYLEKIVVPENVERVGDYAVALLPNLKSLTINAKTIEGTSAFCDNYYVTELIIGTNLTTMKEGGAVFRKLGMNLSNTITIQYTGTMSQWNNIDKASTWKQNSKIIAVQCTDGTISF